jgi:hypothetical protein
MEPKRVFLFLDQNDVQIFWDKDYFNPEGYPQTWALVDSDVHMVEPRAEFINSRSKFFVVQASSPQPHRWKAWKKKLSADLCVMNPWSWTEFYIGG